MGRTSKAAKGRIITQEDLDNNPELEAQGLNIGDAYPEEKADEKSAYPLYEKWRVDIQRNRDGESDKAKVVSYTFTAVKKLSVKAVKIEANVAEQLNRQSHNNLVRYYAEGSVTNGDEETINA